MDENDEDMEQQLELDVSAYAEDHHEEPQDAESFLDTSVSFFDPNQIVYPGYKIYRWWKGAIADHFYTKNPNENAATSGYAAEGVPFITVSEHAPDSRPLYRYWTKSSSMGDHFYTTSSNAEGHMDAFSAEGTIGNVFIHQKPQTVPLYRCYSSSGNDHFYTLHSYCENAVPPYHVEGIVGYVYPGNFQWPSPPAIEKERDVLPTPGYPIHAWEHTKSHDFFMCIDPKGEIAPKIGYKNNGVAFIGADVHAVGSRPLYRFLGPGKHFYTLDKGAEGHTDFKEESTIGNVFPFRAAGTLPLNRCFNIALQQYWYTVRDNCDGRAGYLFETQLGYVYPPDFNQNAVMSAHKFVAPRVESDKIYPASDIHRCYGTANGNHRYVGNDLEKECRESGFNYEGKPFVIVSTRAPGSVPFYRFRSHSNGEDFYTQSSTAEGHPTSFDALGNIGHVFKTMQPGTIPLHRCYNPGSNDHFYTAHPNCEDAGGWNYEGTAGWVYPAGTTLTIKEDSAVQPAPMALDTKVFRWFNPKSGSYFLTTDPRGEIAARIGYRYEQIAFVTVNATADGKHPVYRFQGNGQHLYSTARNAEGFSGYKYEGLLGYAYDNKRTGTMSLYRCYEEKSTRFLYTLDRACEQKPGFYLENRLGYVYPAGIEFGALNGVVGLAGTNNAYGPARGDSASSYNPANNSPMSQLQNFRNLMNETGAATQPANNTITAPADDTGASIIAKRNGIDAASGFFTYPNGTSVALGVNGTTVINAELPNPENPLGCYNNATIANGHCICTPQFTGKWCQLMSPTYMPRDIEEHRLGNLTTLIDTINTRLTDLQNAAGSAADIDKAIADAAKVKVSMMEVKYLVDGFHEAVARNDMLNAKEKLNVIKHLSVPVYVNLSRELALHEDKMNTEFSQMHPVIQKMALPVMHDNMYNDEFVNTTRVMPSRLASILEAERLTKIADARRLEFNMEFGDAV